MAKVICPCFSISDEQLLEALRNGNIEGLEQFMDKTRAGTACGQCKADLVRILEQEEGSQRETEEPYV